MPRLRMSTHAKQRAVQRLGRVPSLDGVVRVPRSAARRFTGWCPSGATRGTRFYASATALFVARGGVVVTCMRLEPQNLAELLVRALFHA